MLFHRSVISRIFNNKLEIPKNEQLWHNPRTNQSHTDDIGRRYTDLDMEVGEILKKH